MFAVRSSVEQVELGEELAPRFDAEGLLPAIVIEVESGSVLMLGYMNADARERTIHMRNAYFRSRSRAALWRKGEHSDFTQPVEHILVDDDQDAIILHVRLAGPGSCHVGYRCELVPPARKNGPVALRRSIASLMPRPSMPASIT
jgi:phosphoribosyl-AMP cyclohydrolase